MVLTTGTQLGFYQVVSSLGAGGMGEVYRTRDTRLGREVAIKTLAQAFTADSDTLARFEREARLLASLNHPNICAIYGLEEAEGLRFLVLELVHGDTLAERLLGPEQSPRAVPVIEALTIARQIAEALEAAHEKNVIHRDLKPSNIKITPDGAVKVLDFGIAKAVSGAAGADLTQSPTVVFWGTGEGVILGTAAYMSPEQARGKEVDKRTDIWAFGCVLYEMLTGRVPFAGDTVADTIGKILERDVDWSALPATTPPPVRRLLLRCLVKDPKHRLRDIGDARLDIDEALAGGADQAGWSTLAAAPARDIQFHRLTDLAGIKESPAISPDGKMAAFVALVKGRRQIWIRLLAGGVPLQVTRDNAEHEHPRWAPDSSTIIYYRRPSASGQEGALWEVSALGGPPRLLASATGGGDVSHDGRSIAVFRSAGEHVELILAPRDGLHARCLMRLRPDRLYSSPRWSPDDQSIAFIRADSGTFDFVLEIVSVADSRTQEVARSESLRGFCWQPDGSGLVISSSSGSTLLYPPVFNLRAIARDGTADRQLTFGDVSYVDPDVGQSGKLLACRVRSRSDIWRFPVSGPPAENTRGGVRITRQTGHVQTPSVSPDGTEVVYLADNGGHGNLWIASTDGADVRQLTFERDPAVAIGVPMWSPVGDWIVFIVTSRAHTSLSVIRPDGTGLREVVRGWSACWSRGGRCLYYTPTGEGPRPLEKIPIEDGSPIVVREDGAWGLAVGGDDTTLYHVQWPRQDLFGRWGDAEIRGVALGTGAVRTLATISGRRVPVTPLMLQPFLSPDDRWLALPLMDGATANLWAIPTDGGPMRQLTDFGDRAILVARSVSWSSDSQHLYAAVSENETDVVLFDGLIR